MDSRAILLCPDAAARRDWLVSLQAAGCAVELLGSVAEVGTGCDLLVAQPAQITTQLDTLFGSLESDSKAALVIPAHDLGQMFGLMSKHRSINATVVQSHASGPRLTAMAAKLTRGNVFGLEKVVPWGARIHSGVIASHDDRVLAIDALTDFGKSLRLRAKYIDALVLVADELLMNALYDAPAVASQEVAATARRPALLQYASTGDQIVLAVRDSFGSLSRQSVLSALQRCVQSATPVQRDDGGAGLGLYLVTAHVSELIFNYQPGVATEVVCSIDCRVPKQRLMHLGFYEESATHSSVRPATERRSEQRRASDVAAPARRPTGLVPLMFAASIVVLLVAGLLLVWPYFQQAKQGTLTVSSAPPGASIYVDGVRRGVASPSLVLADLSAGSAHVITGRLEGHAEGRELITVAANAKMRLTLRLSKRRGALRVTSSPPGATIWLDGRSSGRRTPSVLTGLALAKHRVRLEAVGFEPEKAAVDIKADETSSYHATLKVAAGFALIKLRTTPPNAHLFVNEVDTAEITPIAGRVLRAGQTYRLRLVLAGHVPWEYRWTPRSGEELGRNVALAPGGRAIVTTNIKAKIAVAGRTQALPFDSFLPVGSYEARIFGVFPRVEHRFPFSVKAGATFEQKLDFGSVEPAAPNWLIKTVRGRPARLLALLPGDQKLLLINPKTGEKHVITLKVRAKTKYRVKVPPPGAAGAKPAGK